MSDYHERDPGMQDEVYEKFVAQTTEQFAALGHFVQKFELMVQAARGAISGLVANLQNEVAISIMLNHSAMTAVPLIEILRAIIGNATKEKPQGADFRAVMTGITTEYVALAAARNRVLHGTWGIGWRSSNQMDFSEITAYKFKPGPSGLEPVDMPTSAKELDELSARCDKQAGNISVLYACLIFPDVLLERQFFKERGKWIVTGRSPRDD